MASRQLFSVENVKKARGTLRGHEVWPRSLSTQYLLFLLRVSGRRQGRGGGSPKYLRSSAKLHPCSRPLCRSSLASLTPPRDLASTGSAGLGLVAPGQMECVGELGCWAPLLMSVGVSRAFLKTNEPNRLDEALLAYSVGRSLAGRLKDAHLTRCWSSGHKMEACKK